ncbi:MAG TPA: hypothetical protein VNC63_05085 [Propionibacteriaceae bacterium]|nr:hypothetical protein [Propionibacteriaceae bacterium]
MSSRRGRQFWIRRPPPDAVEAYGQEIRHDQIRYPAGKSQPALVLVRHVRDAGRTRHHDQPE